MLDRWIKDWMKARKEDYPWQNGDVGWMDGCGAMSLQTRKPANIERIWRGTVHHLRLATDQSGAS
jgi:hypothetical protein